MNKQLSLFNGVGDNKSCSATLSVAEQKRQAIQRYLDRAETDPTVSVGVYKPSNRKNGYGYFRLVYRVGKKVKTLHICGGNIHSELAQYRARKLQEMINRGAELEEILAAAKTFNGNKKRHIL